MNDIDMRIGRAQNCWNERLKAQMGKKGYTQTGLARALQKKYSVSSTQTSIFRWLNAGDKLKGTGGFPKYENMIRIADLLGVDVGFLTGETDAESFNVQKAAEFLGLNEEAVCAIRALTKPRNGIGFGIFSHEYADMLNRVLASRAITDVLIALKDYQEPYDLVQRPEPDFMGEVYRKYSEATISSAIECSQGVPDEEGPEPTEELCGAVADVSAAMDNGYAWQLEQEEHRKTERSYRYALQEATSRLLDDIYPQNHTN